MVEDDSNGVILAMFLGQARVAQAPQAAFDVRVIWRNRLHHGGGELAPDDAADLRKLLEQDWRNVAAGIYAPPEDWRGNLLAELRGAIDFFSDLGAVEARRHGDSGEALLKTPEAARYPAYYRRNFHFQSDGYLSAASAARYDHQVEVLFGGGAAAMRRQEAGA